MRRLDYTAALLGVLGGDPTNDGQLADPLMHSEFVALSFLGDWQDPSAG